MLDAVGDISRLIKVTHDSTILCILPRRSMRRRMELAGEQKLINYLQAYVAPRRRPARKAGRRRGTNGPEGGD
jgi:hypothetical protein